MDRYWLLTTTTYGTWLPGDARGFVSPVRDRSGAEVTHNAPGTPYDRDIPQWERVASGKVRGGPVFLTQEHADVLLAQFQETARHHGWDLAAVAIMAGHVHVVVGVDGDPDPGKVLGDLKAYGSRALNRRCPRPASGTWWTESGSNRKLPDARAIDAAIRYIQSQPKPLAVWVDPHGERNGEQNGERDGERNGQRNGERDGEREA